LKVAQHAQRPLGRHLEKKTPQGHGLLAVAASVQSDNCRGVDGHVLGASG
jgi:hypothetical protein